MCRLFLLFSNVIKRSEKHKKRKTARSETLALQGFRRGGEEPTGRHTVETHVEKEQTGSRLSNTKKKEMKRSEEKGDGGRMI